MDHLVAAAARGTPHCRGVPPLEEGSAARAILWRSDTLIRAEISAALGAASIPVGQGLATHLPSSIRLHRAPRPGLQPECWLRHLWPLPAGCPRGTRCACRSRCATAAAACTYRCRGRAARSAASACGACAERRRCRLGQPTAGLRVRARPSHGRGGHRLCVVSRPHVASTGRRATKQRARRDGRRLHLSSVCHRFRHHAAADAAADDTTNADRA